VVNPLFFGVPVADPDRFLQFPTPGAQEWWYFDAISDDGRDALVVVWYAGLPFDPEYGVGTLRHLKDPARHSAPRALDHSAISVSWYRDGKTIAYALNAYRAGAFAHRAEPFAVEVAGSRLARDPGGYALDVDTPAVDGKSRIRARLQFRPAPGTEPLERDLGSAGSPHRWILAAADCRVEGTFAIEGARPTAVEFRGRGYHDHNAGSEELSIAIRRWQWGRVHHGPLTEVYYHSEPRRGAPQSLWITCRDGRPVAVRERVAIRGERPRRSLFGLGDPQDLIIEGGGQSFGRRLRTCVDDGPFYRRSLSDFGGLDEPPDEAVPGISELLDTRNLHHPMLNWMIPYRLKRPRV